MCECVSVSVNVSERGRERERAGERKRGVGGILRCVELNRRTQKIRKEGEKAKERVTSMWAVFTHLAKAKAV